MEIFMLSVLFISLLCFLIRNFWVGNQRADYINLVFAYKHKYQLNEEEFAHFDIDKVLGTHESLLFRFWSFNLLKICVDKERYLKVVLDLPPNLK